MNELSGITTAQAWQGVRMRYIAKVCFEVRKKDLRERERGRFSPLFYQKWVKIILIRREYNFLLE